MSAVQATKETWYEAEINRVAGEIALLGTEPNMAKAEAYFATALEIARKQKAKSWELRAAMSMARLLYVQGERERARDILAPIYRLVHRRLRYARLAGGKVLARRLAQDLPIIATLGTSIEAPRGW